MPSLKTAKHVAEMRHRTEMLKRTRGRLGAVALGSGAVAVLLLESPLLAIAATVVAGAAGLEWAATYLERYYGRAREVSQ